jgi:hypothetical protein
MTSGTTEGINLVAYGWAMPRMEAGDEIVLSIMEHHANIVPWHFLRERQGVVLKWVEVDARRRPRPQRVIDAIGPRTKLVAVTHLSNVLGTKVDVKAICAGARARGVPVLVDGSQAAVHMAVDVQDIGCDFYAITGHKLYGPSGSGAIWIAKERMAEMRPFIGGGDMIREVTRDTVTYNDPPMKFEAGTPGIVQQIGLGVALDYMMGLGMDAIAAHEAGSATMPARGWTGSTGSPCRGRARTRPRSSPSRSRGRRMRTTSRPCSTRRGWRCARASTARGRSCSTLGSRPPAGRPSGSTTPKPRSTFWSRRSNSATSFSPERACGAGGLTLYRPHGAPVAQLDRVLPSEGRGHRFESCRVRQVYRPFVPKVTRIAPECAGSKAATFSPEPPATFATTATRQRVPMPDGQPPRSTGRRLRSFFRGRCVRREKSTSG